MSLGSRSFKSKAYDGRFAKILVVSAFPSNLIEIQFLGSPFESLSIPVEFLVPVRPEKKQSVKTTMGEHRGKIGSLIGIDGADGIVRFEGVTDFNIMNMQTLAKLAL